MLTASHVSVSLGGAVVLRDASLTVAPGEVLSVIGPNGAGKSTLLHVLSGAVRACAGAVTLDGTPLGDWPRPALARRRAVLAQTPVLAFPFRVLDVVLLGRSPYPAHAERAEELRIAAAALAETGVLHLADRVFTTLSGGERQRVQLARVLAQIWPDNAGAARDRGARYLLLDEPTNNLDIAHQQATMETARRLAERGLGVMAVLHDPNLAAAHSDRICVLRDGRVAASGPPETVLTEPLIEATFGIRAKILRHPEHGRPVMLPA